jgi:ssDNA-binding Zn-finger/Zn-ribbon topoisomerase 1
MEMADSGASFQRRYRYYEILEISKNATQEEIKKAFRHLAQKYHPDRNPGNREAEAKFKKINEAYQILSDPAERAAYDSSPAECPVCWTHEVIQTTVSNWRCRHCGCQFDVFGSPLSETIERAAISGRYRVRLTAFQSMQCSWCRRFFTQPFLCPYRLQLHSSCFFFDGLSAEERGKLLDDDKWWWRIVDLVRQTENNGIIKKCVQCGALNPNPKKLICWNCGHSIYDRCPNCGLPTLHFDLDSNLWRCANARCHGKQFAFEKKLAGYKQYGQPEEYAPQGVANTKCPKCGHNLRFDSAMLFWRCTNRKCRSIYTYDELRKTGVERSTSYRSGFQSRDTYTSKYYEENRTPYEPRGKKSRRAPKIIGIILAFILAILILVAVDPFSPSLSVSPSTPCFVVDTGLNPPAQMLEIESSKEAMTWSARDDAAWLNLDPANGSTDKETSITLSADISGMYPGEYAATITISAPDARNTPLKILVSLVITGTKETLAIKEAVGGNTNNVEIYYDVQPPYSKGLAYTNINLDNYERATDSTWQELREFIRSDTTDEDIYLEGIYMCGSFAETLHNNAEQAGIRAAWVAIDFVDGSEQHAFNAFYTTDRGIVFVDCTGGGFQLVVPSLGDSYGYDIDYDKIAYVQVGAEYGVISLDRAESPSYDFYEDYMQEWDNYNEKVDEYNTALGGRTVIYDYSEYEELKRMYDELELQRKILEDYYWEPLGIVTTVEIYW